MSDPNRPRLQPQDQPDRCPSIYLNTLQCGRRRHYDARHYYDQIFWDDLMADPAPETTPEPSSGHERRYVVAFTASELDGLKTALEEYRVEATSEGHIPAGKKRLYQNIASALLTVRKVKT